MFASISLQPGKQGRFSARNDGVRYNAGRAMAIIFNNLLALTTLFSFVSQPMKLAEPSLIDSLKFYKFVWEIETRPNFNIDFIQNITESCEPCTYEPKNLHNNSTPRDVILAYAIGGAYNLIPFMRTLRTTGSKASVVFFVDDKAYNSISDHTMAYVKNCGVNFIKMGKVIHTGKYSQYSIGYLYMQEFIKQNLHRIDRVMRGDMYDMLFQGDPFYDELPKGQVQLVDEEAELKINPGQQMWWNESGRPYTENDLTYRYPCMGYIYGEADVFLKFLEVFLTEFQFDKGIMDQGLVAAMIRNNDFKNNGVEINQTIPFYTRHMYFARTMPEETLGTMRISYNPQKYAVVLHHTHHNHGLKVAQYKFCPPPVFENYISHCDERCMNEVKDQSGVCKQSK